MLSPITLSAEVSKLWNAAQGRIGLTEDTDSVAVIVSEETGQISVVLGGKIEGKLDMGTLRDMLTDIFASKKAKK
jgi:diadenylate cyclase